MEEEGKKALGLQQQQLLMQQRQQQLLLMQRQQQQQQLAMARFPSNIDAHLRAPGMRPIHLQPQHQPLHHQQEQQQQQPPLPPAASTAPPAATATTTSTTSTSAPGRTRQGNPIEAEMVHQDVMNVCNPDFKRPFSSIEDAVLRLLPYHVVADYEAEEDDRILDSDTTGQLPSRLQQWDHNILAKIAELTATFEKQVLAFNIMSRKRALGEFRSEEKLMIEQALLQDEKQTLLGLRAEIESREKAGREAAEARMRMAVAQAEHARAEAHAQAEMASRMPPRAIRANAAVSHGEVGSGNDMGQQQQQQQGGIGEDMVHGWENIATKGEGDEDPSVDFLNDENEQENGDVVGQEWQNDAGELDLNMR